MNLMKSFGAILGILVIPLILFQGCTSSTNSTSSGSGTLPKVQIIPATSSLQASEIDPLTWSSTFITVIVRDNNGNPVPAGIPINITCGAGFLGDPDASLNSITVNTNSNGQVQVKYTAGFTSGIASISATSQGNSGSTFITVQ